MSARVHPEEVAAVAQALADLSMHVSLETTRLYRLHLQATITSASPLTLDLAAFGGFSLDDIAERLPVPPGWRTRLPSRPVGIASAWPRLRRPHPSGKPGDLRHAGSLRAGTGAVLVPVQGRTPDELGFIPRSGALDAVARLGSTMLRTAGPRAFLHLPGALPDTVLVNVVGRHLDQVVEHPVLEGRGYVVGAASNDEFGRGAVIRFGTGVVPHALPWADELDAEVTARRRGVGAEALGALAHVGPVADFQTYSLD